MSRIPRPSQGAARARFLGMCLLLPFVPIAALVGQDNYSELRINEVSSANVGQPPPDKTGRYHDMVEIFNGGEQTLVLGTSNALLSLGLSDTEDQPAESDLYRFKGGVSTTPPKGFLVVFLGNRPTGALSCEQHTGFALARDGSEPITLWGPAGTDGKRLPIDRIWLPPLDDDVAVGRYPDGAGPAPLPSDPGEAYSQLHFYPPGTSTFGACDTTCPLTEAPCRGAPNGIGGNLRPRIERAGHSTNHPAAGEAVEIEARVEDDEEPIPSAIARALTRYWVDGVAQPDISMTYDGSLGIQYGGDAGRPLQRWTVWRGTIPGQPAGSKVELTLHVEDSEGLSSSDPAVLCAPGVGPCDDLGLPGPNCVEEPSPGLQYLPCSTPFRYLVGYELPVRLRSLVINEIMAAQSNVIADPSEVGRFDDYIELFNGSTSAVDLSGLWLSDKPFQPQGWPFPAGSSIGPGEHLLVWIDSDGGRCPRSPEVVGDGQECPDPTNTASGAYHANFGLETDGDQIFLFDAAGAGFGWIHGHEFGAQELNVALSLLPDGDRAGSFEPQPGGTPGRSNTRTEASFRRGDANSDCRVDLADAVFSLRYLFQGEEAPPCLDGADADDSGKVEITDPIYLLDFLFQGGPALPPPGNSTPGLDPTADALGSCAAVSC